MHTTPRFPRLLAALTLALACAASEEKSNLEKCAADEKCLVAMHAVDNAQNTVNTVCPQDEHETNAACDAAMDARNSAEELQEKLQPK